MHLLHNTRVPLKTAFGVGCIIIFLLRWFSSERKSFMVWAFILAIIPIIFWVYHIFMETNSGRHSTRALDNFKSGILCFILSEVMFFFGIFWCYFHSSTVVSMWDGTCFSVILINPFGVPLLNTVILLNRGIFITSAHHDLIRGESPTISLFITSVLGIIFTLYQYLEYKIRIITMRDSAFGATFFICTGFHGAHVFVGTTGIIIRLVRSIYLSWTISHTCLFEGVILYWHFVDVVWLFLYLFVYWWPFYFMK
jgi:cytochrome c oxidase subunit 3